MGKGDIKSRRGKLFSGSFGVRRPKKTKNKVTYEVKKGEPVTATVEDKPKKPANSETKKPAPKKTVKPKKEAGQQ